MKNWIAANDPKKRFDVHDDLRATEDNKTKPFASNRLESCTWTEVKRCKRQLSLARFNQRRQIINAFGSFLDAAYKSRLTASHPMPVMPAKGGIHGSTL